MVVQEEQEQEKEEEEEIRPMECSERAVPLQKVRTPRNLLSHLYSHQLVLRKIALDPVTGYNKKRGHAGSCEGVTTKHAHGLCECDFA